MACIITMSSALLSRMCACNSLRRFTGIVKHTTQNLIVHSHTGCIYFPVNIRDGTTGDRTNARLASGLRQVRGMKASRAAGRLLYDRVEWLRVPRSLPLPVAAALQAQGPAALPQAIPAPCHTLPLLQTTPTTALHPAQLPARPRRTRHSQGDCRCSTVRARFRSGPRPRHLATTTKAPHTFQTLAPAELRRPHRDVHTTLCPEVCRVPL